MQDLNNAVPTTHEQDEEFKQMENIGLKEMFAGMGSDLTGGKSNTFDAPNPDAIQYTHGGTLGAPAPQPTLTDIVNNICTQLQLLTSVITSSQNKTTGENSLQETVELVLKQSDWFQQMVRGIIDDTYDFEDYAKDAVEAVVESEVDSYFCNSFDPTDHFDFNDAVQDAVSDQIDDIVNDKMDEALEEYMSGATITISK
jgi:hypothetical protein